MEYHHENNCVFCKGENGRRVAEVTFPAMSDSVVNINHTYVDQSLRGRGVADELLQEVVSELRENNLKAVPTCSYARKWFDEHEECHDLLTRPE